MSPSAPVPTTLFEIASAPQPTHTLHPTYLTSRHGDANLSSSPTPQVTRHPFEPPFHQLSLFKFLGAHLAPAFHPASFPTGLRTRQPIGLSRGLPFKSQLYHRLETNALPTSSFASVLFSSSSVSNRERPRYRNLLGLSETASRDPASTTGSLGSFHPNIAS